MLEQFKPHEFLEEFHNFSIPIHRRLDTRFRELQRRGSEIAGDNTRCKAWGTNATTNSCVPDNYGLRPSMTGAVVGKFM